MNFVHKKAWIAALGLALAASTAGGVALAAGADDWYTGGNATVADPDRTAVPLKLYDASGIVVTTGSINTSLAAFASADSAVRANDQYATLFVHLPRSSTAPGAWPGVQATGTDKFTGGDVVAAPAALAGKPYVRANNGGYTLADVIAALPNNESGASFAKVYELRLRTSSATAGVSDQYAATWVKVTGSSWAITSAPILGGGGGTGTPTPTPGAVNTSVAPTWPSSLKYGTAGTVAVTVNQASGATKPSGTVRLVSGSTTLSTATLSGGAASLALSATALEPGSRSLKVVYVGVPSSFNGSESSAQSVTVAKAAPGTPAFKVTKVPTTAKKGSATLTVATPAGLAAAGGTAKVVLTKGKATKTVTVTVSNGTVTVKLPKLPAGVWTATVTYDGDAHYVSATSKATKFKVKKPKKKG